MKRLATTQINKHGIIRSLVCDKPLLWERLLPKVGNKLLAFQDQTTNHKLNDALQQVLLTGFPLSFSITTQNNLLNCTFLRHTLDTIYICWETFEAIELTNSDSRKEERLTTSKPNDLGVCQTNSTDATLNLKRFTDNLPLVVFEINLFPDGKFEFGFINKEMDSFFPGFNKEAVNADNSLLFVRVHPEDKQKLMDSIRDVFKFSIWDIEYRVVEKGDIRWVKGYGRPEIRMGYITVCTYLQDITKLKRNEEALDRDHKLLRTLIDNLPVSIFVKDINGRKIVANKLDVDYMGLKYEQESLGKTDKDIFGNKNGNGGYIQDLKIIQTGIGIIDEEGQLIYKNGDKRDILVSKVPLKDENGNITGLIGICKDTTNLKKLEERLEIVNYSFHKANVSIFITKKDGDFFDVNELACTSLGYTWKEIMEKKIFDINPFLPIELWKSHWEDMNVTGGRVIFSQHKKKDGTLIDVEINLKMVKYQGQILHCSFVTDITERKKLEEKLIIVDYAFRKSSTATHFMYKDGSIYDFNDAACNLFGYTREEYKKITLFTISTRHTQETWEKRWEELKQNGTTSYSTKLKRKDNALVDVEIISIIFQYGNLELSYTTIFDITEKKKKDEELKRSHERYENATFATSEVVWESDLLADSNYFSKNFTEMFGHPINGLEYGIHNSWRRNLHPDDKERVLAYEASVTKGMKDKWQVEYRLKKANGDYAFVLDKGFSIKNDSGKVVRLVGAMRDITKRKKEEERLKLLEKVVTETSQSIVIAEAKIGNDTPIIYANASFTRITGFTLEEITGKNPRFLHNGLDTKDDAGRRIMRNAIKNYLPWKVEVINTKKNGENYWAEVSGFPVYDTNHGKYTHWVAIQTDITARKEAEEEKEHLVKELVEYNKELKQFGYITTHNLRAPLTNLVSICNLIDIDKIEDERTKKLINGFKLSTTLLNETLNDLIKVLFIKENTNLTKDELAFDEVLEKVKHSIESILLLNAVKIEADFSFCKSVSFVYIYLESIFLNLMTNAVKYSHPTRHPVIKIKTSKEADGHIKLSFTDNGIGMNMERVKNKIFGLYQRFHNNPDGKGIGLYLVQSQVSALGGSIDVESKENVGTTFTIHFKKD